MNWKERRKKYETRNTDPSLTDQSGAASTDINVIMNQFLKTGTLPGQDKEMVHGDFTTLPNDLREAIDQSRSISKLRRGLPEPLASLPIEKLLALKWGEADTLLKPVSKPETAKPKEEAKP